MNAPVKLEPFLGFTEPVASLSHLIGAAVFAVLGFMLVWHGHGRNRVWLVIFALASVFLLSMSGTYHLLPYGTFVREQVFRRLDHAAIFVLIAGTFTAAHGILFRRWWRWGVIGLLWAGTAAAITVTTVFFGSIPEAIQFGLYFGFGWLGLASGHRLYLDYGFKLIRPLLWGGIVYTAGALVELLGEGLWIPGVFGPHEFFHFAVLAGLGFHYAFLWRIAWWRVCS